jgi:hypothetical protein
MGDGSDEVPTPRLRFSLPHHGRLDPIGHLVERSGERLDLGTGANIANPCAEIALSEAPSRRREPGHGGRGCPRQRQSSCYSDRTRVSEEYRHERGVVRADEHQQRQQEQVHQAHRYPGDRYPRGPATEGSAREKPPGEGRRSHACRNGHYQKDSEVGKVVARHPCGRADPERGDGAGDADQAHESERPAGHGSNR